MAAAPVASAPAPLTPAQLAAMDVNQRRSYFQSLPGDKRQAAQSAYATYRDRQNRNYMLTTIPKLSVCPPQSGNALNQTFALGSQLTYNVKSAENAFLEGFIVQVSVNLNFAVGTGAAYAVSDAGPLALIQEIDLLYGNTQMRFRPHFLREYYTLMKYLGWIDALNSIPTGFNKDNTLQAYINNGQVVTTGNQTWTFEFYVPCNLLSPVDPRGMLPIMGGETTAQINIICASSLMSNDPILTPVYANGGTGNAVTLQGSAGTVAVLAVYRDGITLAGPARQGLDLSGLPTVQVDMDPPLNNLLSGNIYRQKFNKAEVLAFSFLHVVDGVAAGKLAAYTNMQVLELDKDSSGNNLFWKYGVGTNISVLEFFAQLRRKFGQDIGGGREGVIPVVYAPSFNTVDPDSQSGIGFMNTTAKGWTDVNYGLQVGATGANGNPRVENHLIYINPVGLIAG